MCAYCSSPVFLETFTELAGVVDIMIVWAKKICTLMIEVNKLFSFFSLQYFLETCSLCFHWVIKFRRTLKSCGNIRLTACAPTKFLILPNFHSCFCNSKFINSMTSCDRFQWPVWTLLFPKNKLNLTHIFIKFLDVSFLKMNVIKLLVAVW